MKLCFWCGLLVRPLANHKPRLKTVLRLQIFVSVPILPITPAVSGYPSTKTDTVSTTIYSSWNVLLHVDFGTNNGRHRLQEGVFHTAAKLWPLPRGARPAGLTQNWYVSMRPHSILTVINGVIIEGIRVPCGNTSIAEQMKRLAFVRLQWRPLDLVAQRSTQLSVPYEAANRTQSVKVADPTQEAQERSAH
jgi:hypothetical protein